MKSREISRSKIGQFSLACTDPSIGIGWEYQSIQHASVRPKKDGTALLHSTNIPAYHQRLQENSPL